MKQKYWFKYCLLLCISEENRQTRKIYKGART